jgi:hypothetical protein
VLFGTLPPRAHEWIGPLPFGPRRIEPGPEQESVWDYPRLPAVANNAAHATAMCSANLLRFIGIDRIDKHSLPHLLATEVCGAERARPSAVRTV